MPIFCWLWFSASCRHMFWFWLGCYIPNWYHLNKYQFALTRPNTLGSLRYCASARSTGSIQCVSQDLKTGGLFSLVCRPKSNARCGTLCDKDCSITLINLNFWFDIWCQLCSLHGGLISFTFCPSVCPSGFDPKPLEFITGRDLNVCFRSM